MKFLIYEIFKHFLLCWQLEKSKKVVLPQNLPTRVFLSPQPTEMVPPSGVSLTTKTLLLLSCRYFYSQTSQIIERNVFVSYSLTDNFSKLLLISYVTLSSSIFDWKIVLITKIFYSNCLLIGSVLSAKLTTSETIK